jgi:hypothetical protein
MLARRRCGGAAFAADARIDRVASTWPSVDGMQGAVALLALCALLVGTAPRALAQDESETSAGPSRGSTTGPTRGTSSPATPSGGSSSGPAASPAPGDAATQLGEPEGENALSPPEVDGTLAEDPYESGDGGNAEDESSLLAPEGRDTRAHDDPLAADPGDADGDDIDSN